MRDFPKLFITVGGCFAVALLGSLVTTPAISGWYTTLDKPFFNPPSWVFAPVWTILFSLMGISAFMVWRKGWNRKISRALLIFFLQLCLNFLWSYSFFSLQQPVLALIDIVALWIAILLTIQNFRKVSKPASLLLIPYLLWVSFASLLNLTIIILNQ